MARPCAPPKPCRILKKDAMSSSAPDHASPDPAVGDRFSPDTLYVVYDGDCPFCSRYVKLLRLRDSVGIVQLVDARDPGAGKAVVAYITGSGFSLDEGMALVRGERIAHGDACVHELALLSTASGYFNLFNNWVFRSSTRTKLLYPAMRAGRNLALRMLGRPRFQKAG